MTDKGIPAKVSCKSLYGMKLLVLLAVLQT